MNDITQILCPLDFSEPSMHALSFAMALTRRLRVPLQLVHVIMPVAVYSTAPEAMIAFPPPFQADDPQRENYAMGQLKAVQKQVEDAGLPASVQLLHGPPGRTIVDLVGQTPNSLLVLGTHGYRGFQRFVLGSTAAEVLRRATCPVFTVRERHEEHSIRRIGVGIDFSAACEPALEAAVRLARTFDAQLYLVHVMRPIDIPNSVETHIPLYVNQVGEATQQAAHRELEEIAARIHGLEVVKNVVVGTSTYRDLAEYAQSAQLDLLAVGTHGRTGLRRLFLGSVSERVLQVSPCPVLSVKLPADVPAELTWREVADDLKLRREET